MNVKEYIASGIVESYVMGLASSEEMAEFERMCAAHSEVRLAREAFEQQLEQQALKHGVKPPPSLKSKIFADLEIETDKRKSNGGMVAESPVAEKGAPVISMRKWKLATAAAVILLLGSTALNIYYANQAKSYKNQYVSLRDEFAQREKDLQVQMTAYQQSLDIVRDTNMLAIRMPGVPKHPESMATVYWNKHSKDVFLMVNNLPQPAQGKQYQLWALVDGKPVDAGMLDWKHAGSVARMKNIPIAQGFAITLENEGGAPQPDMESMHVIRVM